MYQNIYPYTPVYNRYPNMQWSENEYRRDYAQDVGRLIIAPANVGQLFSQGTQIFIHGTYFDTTTGEQIVIVVYPYRHQPTGRCLINVQELPARVVDGIQPFPQRI
ncbi:hypothetical protein [Bacillus cereus]|uniref:hypothetical protein n=1 Tax=Bacillus cereus TaxID=1396 RepID=UPI0039815311